MIGTAFVALAYGKARTGAALDNPVLKTEGGYVIVYHGIKEARAALLTR